MSEPYTEEPPLLDGWSMSVDLDAEPTMQGWCRALAVRPHDEAPSLPSEEATQKRPSEVEAFLAIRSHGDRTPVWRAEAEAFLVTWPDSEFAAWTLLELLDATAGAATRARWWADLPRKAHPLTRELLARYLACDEGALEALSHRGLVRLDAYTPPEEAVRGLVIAAEWARRGDLARGRAGLIEGLEHVRASRLCHNGDTTVTKVGPNLYESSISIQSTCRFMLSNLAQVANAHGLDPIPGLLMVTEKQVRAAASRCASRMCGSTCWQLDDEDAGWQPVRCQRYDPVGASCLAPELAGLLPQLDHAGIDLYVAVMGSAACSPLGSAPQGQRADEDE